MKKTLILTALVLALGTAMAMADDGEGLATPRKGTPERVAYDAANAQYAKDDGNPAYHLEGIKRVDGSTVEGQLTIEVDFNSGEDGEYDYQVEVTQQGDKWVAGKVSAVNN